MEHNKGDLAQVDLDALDRNKKIKDPRTLEFQIAQKNATALSAWKSSFSIFTQRQDTVDYMLTFNYIDAVFDDVDETDLKIDTMNDGQTHRRRLQVEMTSSNPLRGGFTKHGTRGELPPKGRIDRTLPR